MTYRLLRTTWGTYDIILEESRLAVGSLRSLNPGSVEPPYRVIDHTAGNSVEVAVVDSLDQVIPAFRAYQETHPQRWRRVDAARYEKASPYGDLRVEEVRPGHWCAYRENYPLERDGKPAVFETLQEAQRAAEAHERQSYPNTETVDDGLWWPPAYGEWWLDPTIIDRWERCTLRRG